MSDFRFLAPPVRDSKAQGVALGSRRVAAARSAFTLIELLVAISIIGMLAALALGGMWRADVSAKRQNTKTTINKVATQIQEIWESYRNRKLPVDPRLILNPSSSFAGSPYFLQWSAALGVNGYSPGWLPYYSTVRTQPGLGAANTAIYPDPTVPPANNGANPNNNLQRAA